MEGPTPLERAPRARRGLRMDSPLLTVEGHERTTILGGMTPCADASVAAALVDGTLPDEGSPASTGSDADQGSNVPAPGRTSPAS
ncbi:alpha/beta hydrolase [Agrococcus jejuensis]|uniref:alpha/beta hydrolase n=1 Tax=Agrococcus jejuensis TaxID=399736 RepID=UPI0022B261CE|nr:alpha/beta hydrolase [Agrococcus jejuensis]